MASFCLLFILLQISAALCHGVHNEEKTELREFNNILKDVEQVLQFDTKSVFSSNLQNYLTCMIGNFKQQLLQLGLNIDPFNIGFDTSDFDLGFLKGFAKLNEMQLRGITNVTVPQATVSPNVIPLGTRIQGQLLWPNINMTSGYISNMTLLGRPLNATGNSTGDLSQFGFNINALIAQNSIVPRLQSLSIRPSLQKSNFNFGGLKFDDIDLDQGLSSFFSNLAPFINSNSNVFDQLLSPFIETFINNRLSMRYAMNQLNLGIGSLFPNSGASGCQFSIPMLPLP